MNLRESINRLLKEDHKHEFGCAMLYFDFPQMEDIHNLIDPNDLYQDPEDSSFGLETEPHCTLLFGLHDEVSTEDIKKVLDKYSFTTCQISEPSLFKNDKYDVLKFEVYEDSLYKINQKLKRYPNTNSFPDYQAHCTIAYIKRGLGQKYVDLLNKQGLDQFELEPSYAIYSKPDGNKDKIEINK